MSFRVNITVEVDQVGNGLAIQTPVAVQLVCERGQWYGQCINPPVTTDMFETMEKAMVACAQEVGAEVQAAVVERPLIAGRITPKDVAGMFR